MRVAKWLIPCLVAILLVGAAGCYIQGGSPQVISVPAQQNTGIWVTGQGETTAVPDVAILSLGVEAKGDTVAEAQSQAAVAMDKVMQALQDNGIDKKDIQTRQYSIYPITRWVEDEKKEEIIGYRVTNIVVTKIRKVDKAGAVIDAVAQAGGDYIRIQGISFTVDDPTPYYEEARTKAVKDAENKAKQFANLTGVKLGKPTYISEGAVYLPSVNKAYERAVSLPATETPISPGELKITTNVQIVYAIA